MVLNVQPSGRQWKWKEWTRCLTFFWSSSFWLVDFFTCLLVSGGTSIPVRVVISPRDTKWERERSYQSNVWEKGRGLQAARLFLCLGHIFSGAEVGLSGRTGDGKWRGTEMHPKLLRPRQQDEEISILSTHENIHSEVCHFQPVDPSVCILVVQFMHPWSSNLENRCILSNSEQI